jgi:hypothetical protein
VIFKDLKVKTLFLVAWVKKILQTIDKLSISWKTIEWITAEHLR